MSSETAAPAAAPAAGAETAAGTIRADGATPAPVESGAMAPIRALDPAFQTFADLQAMPEAATFNRLVMKGNTLTDAFRLARFESLAARRAAEASKSALSRAYNRAHLSATAVNGARAAMVPPETLEMYRTICPGLSDEEYRAHYRRANKM